MKHQQLIKGVEKKLGRAPFKAIENVNVDNVV